MEGKLEADLGDAGYDKLEAQFQEVQEHKSSLLGMYKSASPARVTSL